MRRNPVGTADVLTRGVAGLGTAKAPADVGEQRPGSGWGRQQVSLLVLGAQGIPGPCPQLVGLGFRYVGPLLRIIQFMLGLPILGQVSAGLLLLGAQVW